VSRSRGSRREYPRTARVAELLREVLGSEIDRLDDPRLDGVVVTGVDVQQELRGAVVWLDADDPDEVLGALAGHRVELQRAVNAQTRLRNTPVLEFRHDTSIGTGGRIEQILADLDIPPTDDVPSGLGPEGDPSS